MSEQWKRFVDDPRTICRYGAKCYQKNSEHGKKFKHPPNLKRKHDSNAFDKKRTKLGTNDQLKPDTMEKPQTKDNLERTCEWSDRKLDKPQLDTPDELPDIKTCDANLTNSQLDTETKITDVKFYDAQSDPNLLKKLFLVDMPLDFFKFFSCLGLDELELLSNVGLQLVGPYELLLGKLPVVDNQLYLVHWRYFYDPPEFQTVLKATGSKSELHFGYYRDSPEEAPEFVGRNDSSQNCLIVPMADNLFGAVYQYLQHEKKRSPFTAMTCQRMMDKVKLWAEENSFSLEEYNIKLRRSKIVTKTLHGAGIVVPYDKKTQVGYRKLAENDATIKKLFVQLAAAESASERDRVLSALQPVITYADIAVDECDFGTGLEAGIALFCSGLPALAASAEASLTAAYTLLKRDAFAKIVQAHMKYRRKGSDMSLLNILSS